MPAPERIAAAAANRIQAAYQNIQQTLDNVRDGNPLEAEPIESRKIERIAAITHVSRETAAKLANNEDPAALGLAGESLSRAEAIQGKTVDYLGVAWLDAGRLASNSVARILLSNGAPSGTGFLVSDRLLLTNNHVIPSAAAARSMIVEFRYELALGQRRPAPVRFALDPSVFFETDSKDDLDYTMVAIGRPLTAGVSLADFVKCPLSGNSAKHLVGEGVNIIQHPDGDFKQIVIRENRILHRGETVLHYLADTEPGSSGSPVFNDQWQVVALHHWGGPHREVTAGGRPLSRDVNEGIRISAIVRELEGRAAGMSAAHRALLRDALSAPPPSDFGVRRVGFGSQAGPHAILGSPASAAMPAAPVAQTEGENAAGAPANRIDTRYSNRRGYNSRFLPGFPVPMPQLSAEQRASAARVRGVGEDGNPFELKYQHFSVVLNASRRMAFYSICNIDGAKRIRVDRKTGQATSEPEATETWAVDPRVPEDAQFSDAFYARLRRDLRTDDFLARGHLTRREDPNWGTEAAAERANDDTYHHPNACPQVNNAFNSSKRAWQGIENFVLNSADDANLRVTVITGPVFANDDPVYEDEEFGAVQLPRRFWKIVARVEDGERKVFAILADQSEALDELVAAGASEATTFRWPRGLSREFRSTVAEIAELTGLDFGDLANHDVFADSGGGESLEARMITSPEALFPRRKTENSFGSFPNIGAFLESWEAELRRQPVAVGPEALEVEEEAGEERRRRRRGAPRPAVAPRPTPAPRGRRVAEVRAEVARVFADDLNGAKHQQFSVFIRETVEVDARIGDDVRGTIEQQLEVRLAVRFGDSRGLPDRIPGIRTGVALHIKGEWIPSEEAYSVGGERLAVLHFTHDPLGFVCTPAECYS